MDSFTDEEGQSFIGKEEVTVSKGNRLAYTILALTTTVILLVASYAYISVNQRAFESLNFSQKGTREVFLFGDSLIGVPDTEYHMDEKIQKRLNRKYEHQEVTVNSWWANGAKVHELLKVVDKEVLDRRDLPAPDAVIVLFDSDAADVKEYTYDRSKIRELYADNLRKLLTKLTAAVPYVALSGPILKGERPDGKNPDDSQLEAYMRINKVVAKEFDVDYIPMREDFFDSEPKHFDKEKGELTIDGEHPSLFGMDIIKENFLEQIYSWRDMWSVHWKNKFHD